MTSYDDELNELDAPELETPPRYSANGLAPTPELDENIKAQIDAEMRKFEDLPQFAKFFTSQDVDDLKITSEIPRRMVMPMVAVDMAIVASTMLNMRLIERAQRSEARYRSEITAFEVALEDAQADGTITKAEQINLDKRVDYIKRLKTKAERHLLITQRHAEEARHRRSMLETYRKSFLQYMRGVDRKGAGELIELWAAMGEADDDKDVDDDE